MKNKRKCNERECFRTLKKGYGCFTFSLSMFGRGENYVCWACGVARNGGHQVRLFEHEMSTLTMPATSSIVVHFIRGKRNSTFVGMQNMLDRE